MTLDFFEDVEDKLEKLILIWDTLWCISDICDGTYMLVDKWTFCKKYGVAYNTDLDFLPKFLQKDLESAWISNGGCIYQMSKPIEYKHTKSLEFAKFALSWLKDIK